MLFALSIVCCLLFAAYCLHLFQPTYVLIRSRGGLSTVLHGARASYLVPTNQWRRIRCVQDLTLLSSGAVLLWFGVRSAPNGKAAVQGLLSFDQGRSWSARRLTLADGLPGPDSTYPSTARLGDGMLCTVYYSAGTEAVPQDMYVGRDVACFAVRYEERALLEAFAAAESKAAAAEAAL